MVSKKRIVISGIVTSFLYAVLAFIALYYQTSATTPWGSHFKLLLLITNLLLVFFYAFAFRSVKEVQGKDIKKVIILFSFVFCLIMILIPPIGSADVYNYAYRARVDTVYGENPYIVTTGEYTDDMFYNFSPKEWNHLPMQYGPFWTSVSILFSNITRDSFFWNIFLYKLLALFSFLGVAVLISKILKKIKPEADIRGLLLYLWNPVIIFEAINNAHNDMLMVFAVIFAIYLLIRKWYTLSFVVLLISILIKYVPLLILPVLVIYVLRNIHDARKKTNFILTTIFLSVVICILYYLPFWEGMATFKGLLEQSKIFTYANFSLFPGMIFWILYAIGKSFAWPNGLLIGIARFSGLVSFIILFALLVRNYLRERNSNLIYYSFMILSAYVFFYLAYLQPWYFVWLIPLAILMDKKYSPHFIIICSFACLLSYTIILNSLIYFFIFIILVLVSLAKNKNYLFEFIK